MTHVVPKPRVSPVGKVLDELLSDGEWHSIEDLLDDLVVHVPPGQAHRRAEGLRRSDARRRDREETARQHGDDVVAVAVGARKIAQDTIRTRVIGCTVERDGDRVRRRQ